MTRFSHLSLYLVKPLAFSTALFSLSLSLPLSPRLRCVGAGEQVDFNVLTSPSLPTLLLDDSNNNRQNSIVGFTVLHVARGKADFYAYVAPARLEKTISGYYQTPSWEE